MAKESKVTNAVSIVVIAVVLTIVVMFFSEGTLLYQWAHEAWIESYEVEDPGLEASNRNVRLENVRLAREGSQRFLVGDLANVGTFYCVATFDIDLFDVGGEILYKARDSKTLKVHKVWHFEVPIPAKTARFRVNMYQGLPVDGENRAPG